MILLAIFTLNKKYFIKLIQILILNKLDLVGLTAHRYIVFFHIFYEFLKIESEYDIRFLEKPIIKVIRLKVNFCLFITEET